MNRVRSFLAALAIFLAPLAHADFKVDVAEAPTSNLALTVNAIKSARESIYLNIYELSSPDIADALLDRIQAGVHVEILEEGQPVGGMSAAEKGIQAQIVQAMQGGGDRFFLMTSKGWGKNASQKRRFRFDHAKYAVIDGQELLIGSENYSPTGNPTPGTTGNRGWEVLLHDSSIAQDYRSVFSGDADPQFGDVIELTPGSVPQNFLTAARRPRRDQNQKLPPPAPDFVGGESLDASAVSRVSSPDTSLSGIVAILDQAQTSIDIQQMTFDSAWSSGPNPLIAAIERAAGRGVQVRVLLNDEAVFNHGNPSKSKNLPTIERLNSIPGVTARTANLKGMGVDYIHNKGLLVDSQYTLVSSINWDENSIQNNREAAVLITSPAVHAHYESLFEQDWGVSGDATQSKGGTNQGNPQDAVAQDTVAEETLVCPAALRVTAQIGDLRVDRDEQSFASIAGQTVTGTFRRVGNPESCVFTSSDAVGLSPLSLRSFVEIKLNHQGYSINLEGYTPVGHKLYSIRAKVPKDGDFLGGFGANVFNGSSAREFLGRASLEIEALP